MSRKLDNIFEEFTKANIFANREYRNDVLMKASATATDVEPYRPPKKEFRRLIGKTEEYSEDIGDHPDFSDLDWDEKENHYIVSVFLDIKGSTLLGVKLPLEDVRFIKNGILVTAIDFFQIFDGHVHRLQGDAVCAFFGGKQTRKSDAIIDALNSTSFLHYYFERNLLSKLENMGFPSIKVRIGIDFGNDEKVLWTRYGIKNTDEVTPTSIHTDLAAKLESKAPANNTMIGDNIINYLDLPDEFYKLKMIQRDNEEKADRYIMNNEDFTYKMWIFNWEKYIDRFPFLKSSSQYPYNSPNTFKIKCLYKYKEDENFLKEYKSNCGSLPKNVDLKFELDVHSMVNYDDVIWEVNNRGEEANVEKNLNFTVDDYKGKTFCHQVTKYKGHHYMKCILKNNGRIIGETYFGIYVSDD